jgi:AcrR family transcriptional regulator
MKVETEQKILTAALKVFSERGYIGARIKFIALESGFTEMTIFRIFDTKENLFKMVLITNQERVLKEFNSVLSNHDYESPNQNLATIIKHLVTLVDQNFEYVNILIKERKMISDSVIKRFISHLTQYLDKLFPETDVDHQIIAFNILSYLYFIIFDKRLGNTLEDRDKAVEEFIKYIKKNYKP